MYEEFIIGYILSGLAVVLLTVVIILQCVIIKKIGRSGRQPQQMAYNPYAGAGVGVGAGAYGGGRGTAICRNCATQFDPIHSVCPTCGTPR